MGNVIVGVRESISDDALDVGGILDFEHCFAAAVEDATSELLPAPLPGYIPSTGPPGSRKRDLNDTIHEPLTGRLVQVHMLETELLLKETVGVEEQTLLRVPYVSIQVLTWDHASSSLKVEHEAASSSPPRASEEEGGAVSGEGEPSTPERVFFSLRVENSIDLEDELKQRAKAESIRARRNGLAPPAAPASLYLGMFAGFTKPKPFQRKRPNLSFTVPEGQLPSLKEMRRWSNEEHAGISRPQLCSLRPKLAMDAVLLGENRYSLSGVEGLSSSKDSDTQYRPQYGELVLTFASLRIQFRAESEKNVSFSYGEIDDWSIHVVPGTGLRAPSGLELWITSDGEQPEQEDLRGRQSSSFSSSGGTEENGICLDHQATSEAKKHLEASGRPDTYEPGGNGGVRQRRIFLAIPDEDLVLARNSMEYYWNTRRGELRLPPKAGSTHGRCVASMVTLGGEVKVPSLPTGRTNPVDINGIEVRVGQEIQLSPRRGHLHLMPSPRAILRVEKKRTLRYNDQARAQWERAVVHQGWLRKRGGGAIKRWIWRYFVLYDTPQGHFLGYYNDVSDVPLFNEARKERQLVDLCKVCFLRPEIGRQRQQGPGLPANAFTIVTTDRQWTLAAGSRAAVLEWLCMLSVAVDEDVAVVHDGEITFEIKAHWADPGGSYGPENAGTVHLGSMGMELRFGYPETAAASLAALAGNPKKRASYSASYATNVRFWSFTDFYKWTMVSLHDGARGLALQCFVDDEFETKEHILLITPYAKRLALAIEHQVEKFMAVMHLRLEHPDTMVVETPTPEEFLEVRNGSTGEGESVDMAQSSDEGGDPDGSAVSEASGDGTRDSNSPKSDADELLRAPSMNLATDPAVWIGDATITPGAPWRRTSDGSGGINPFDSSSDEENSNEVTEGHVGIGGVEARDEDELGKDLGRKQSNTIYKSSNPFDFLFHGGKDSAEAGAVESAECSRDSEVEKTNCQRTPASEFAFSEAASDATGAALSPTRTATAMNQESFFPLGEDLLDSPAVEAPPPSTGASPGVQLLDLALIEALPTLINTPISPQGANDSCATTPTNVSSLPYPPPSADSAAGSSGMTKVPQGKLLPPTPLIAFDVERHFPSTLPTPPVTPFSIPQAKAPTEVDPSPAAQESMDDSRSPGAAEQPGAFSLDFGNTTGTAATFDTQEEDDPVLASPKGAEATFFPTPTEEQTELHLAFRDNTEGPASPLPAEIPTELHLAFRDREDTSLPVRGDLPSPVQPGWQREQQQPELPPKPIFAEPHESGNDAGSSRAEGDFNPFGRPGNSVSHSPPVQESSPSGTVLHDNGSSVRAIVEDFEKSGRTCSLTLRYELHVAPKTRFSVEFATDAQATSTSTSTSPLEISFQPDIVSVEVGEGDREGDAWRKELRQVISITCLRAFSSPPEIVLTTSDMPLATTIVPLPVVTVAAFVTGLRINPDEFRQRWTTLSCTAQGISSNEEVLQHYSQQQQKQKKSFLEGSSDGGEPATKLLWEGPRIPSQISPAGIKRLLVDSLGMKEVVQERPAGEVTDVALIAAAGELLLTPTISDNDTDGVQGEGNPKTVMCLVGVELHGTSGAARVTTKSIDQVLADNLQKEVLKGVDVLRWGTKDSGGTAN